MQVATAAASEDRSPASSSSASAKKARLGDRLRRFFFAQPSILRGALLLPLWALGKALLALFGALLSALHPIWQALLGVLLNAGLVFGLFALVFKLLFPDKACGTF